MTCSSSSPSSTHATGETTDKLKSLNESTDNKENPSALWLNIFLRRNWFKTSIRRNKHAYRQTVETNKQKNRGVIHIQYVLVIYKNKFILHFNQSTGLRSGDPPREWAPICWKQCVSLCVCMCACVRMWVWPWEPSSKSFKLKISLCIFCYSI